MNIVRVPEYKYREFEQKYDRFEKAFGNSAIDELLLEVRYNLYSQGYKIDSIITVYYLLYHVFGNEEDASKWNLYQSIDIIVNRTICKIWTLSKIGKLMTFQPSY